MNVLNRILIILAILVALALVGFLMYDPITAADTASKYLGLFKELIFDNQFYFVYMVTLGVLAFVLLLLLWGEIRRGRKRSVKIRTQGGNVKLGIQSVAESLEYRIDELAGVRKVQPHVRSRGRDVDVEIDLDTSPSVNVPVLTEQINDLVRDIVEGQLGVKIHGKVRVNVRHEPYPRGTMPPTGPLSEEAVSSPPASAPTHATAAPPPMPAPEPLIASSPDEGEETADA